MLLSALWCDLPGTVVSIGQVERKTGGEEKEEKEWGVEEKRKKKKINTRLVAGHWHGKSGVISSTVCVLLQEVEKKGRGLCIVDSDFRTRRGPMRWISG